MEERRRSAQSAAEAAAGALDEPLDALEVSFDEEALLEESEEVDESDELVESEESDDAEEAVREDAESVE